jgi:alpha-beta hydrolase superfamily lysophospholipase
VDTRPLSSEAPERGEHREVAAADGYRLRYRVWPAAPARATVALVNGVMSHSAWFDPLAVRLAGRGFRVVGADRRGSGRNVEARGDAPSASILVDDLRRILDAEMQPPLVLAGWCWGAVLALAALPELGARVSALALLAPGLFPSDAVLREIREQDAVARSSAPDDPCIESPVREEQFTDGPLLDELILADPLRVKRITPRFLRAMRRLAVDAARSLARLDVPTLAILAGRDEVVDNARTVRALRDAGARVAIATCNGRHGIQLEAPDDVEALLSSWIGDVLAGAGA